MKYLISVIKGKLFWWEISTQEQGFIENDSTDLNNFDDNDLLSEDYEIDYCSYRNSWDHTINKQSKDLLGLCVSSRLRILNGRYVGDLLGNYTCITNNGYSLVDYAIVSQDLLLSVKYFQTHDFNYLSDHTQTELYLRCNFDIQKNDTFLNQNGLNLTHEILKNQNWN